MQPMESMNILVVEDDSSQAGLVQLMLREVAGDAMHVVIADSLVAALDELETESFDVILTNLNLSDSFGLDTLLTIREQSPELPVVVLTAAWDERLLYDAMGHGAQAYLIRGQFDASLLLRALRLAVTRKLVETNLLTG